MPVTEVSGGWVTVVAAEPGLIRVGDRFIVHSRGQRVRVSESAPQGPALVDAPMGMFAVTWVNGKAASGPIPRGTIAHVGDTAEPTQAPLRVPKFTPRMWDGMGRFYMTLRPIVQTGQSLLWSPPSNSGFGMMNDLTLEYYFPEPVKLGVQLAPLGITTGNRPGLSSELHAVISYASSYFELGVEPGAELHLLLPAKFSLGYVIRIGSLDGLNLIFHNSYVLDRGDHPGVFYFGSASGEINVPLTQRYTLYLSGGGAANWNYMTLELKHYLRGGGGPGTVVLHGGAGFAYVNDCAMPYYQTSDVICEWSEGLGPTFATGIDARF